MKKIYFLFLTMLLTLISCEEEKSPIQIAMENYILERIDDPSQFKFESIGPGPEYRYGRDLEHYREELVELLETNPSVQKEIDNVDRLIKQIGYLVGVHEHTMHFWLSTNGSAPSPRFIYGQFDEDGNVISISANHKKLDPYPCLQVLKNKGLIGKY